MVLFYAELAILVRINAKMHYFEPPRPHPYWGGGTPLPKPHSLDACGASPHICQPQLFFHNSHTNLTARTHHDPCALIPQSNDLSHSQYKEYTSGPSTMNVR